MDVEFIKKTRKEHGDTQDSLAEKLGIQQRTYASYERGEREMPNDIIIKYADLYKVTVDRILGRKTEEPSAMVILDSDRQDVYDQYKFLFDAVKGATSEDVQAAVALLNALKARSRYTDENISG